MKHGFGRLVCSNNSFYEGYWQEDQFEGQGFYLDDNGNFIRGFFKNGKPEGQCFLMKLDGCSYEGQMYF